MNRNTPGTLVRWFRELLSAVGSQLPHFKTGRKQKIAETPMSPKNAAIWKSERVVLSITSSSTGNKNTATVKARTPTRACLRSR